MDSLTYLRNRCRRIIKRRYTYLRNALAELGEVKAPQRALCSGTAEKVSLQCGDLVRIKSQAEIQRSLDRWNQLRKCSYMEEMWPYCGTNQRVFKRVEKFLDERDYHLKKCNGIYILEGVHCQGTIDFGACDRSCFFFWREEWLEKIADTGGLNATRSL